jgi:hypothetical protein
MRKVIQVLIALAAVCFFFGIVASFLGAAFWPGPLAYVIPAFDPETYWRGATALLLFAITLMMWDRHKAP